MASKAAHVCCPISLSATVCCAATSSREDTATIKERKIKRGRSNTFILADKGICVKVPPAEASATCAHANSHPVQRHHGPLQNLQQARERGHWGQAQKPCVDPPTRRRASLCRVRPQDSHPAERERFSTTAFALRGLTKRSISEATLLPKAKLLRIPQDLIPGRSTSKARRESAKGTRVNPNGTSKAPETTQAESPTHSRRDRTPSGERHNPERRLRSLTHKGVRSCLLHDGEASQRGGRKRKRGPRSAPSQSRKTKQGKEEGSHPHQVSPEGPTGQIREGGGERGISSRNQAQPGLYAGR
jgi:hypothetical protein